MKTIYLKTARDRAGWTQEQLEAKAGVPQAVISKLERRADVKPTFSTVLKLADALKLDPRQLRFGQPESGAAA